jgi:hypothetical protein
MTASSTAWTAAARAAAIVAVALLVLAAGLAGAAGAEDDAPTPADTPMGPPLSATLSSIAPSYLTPSTSLSLRIAVTAGTGRLTGVQSIVSVTQSPLASPVDAFLADPSRALAREVGRGQPAEFLQGVPRAPGTLDAGSAATTSLLIGPSTLALPRSTSGVYGFTVTTVADAVEPVTSAFVMTWTDSTLERVEVSVLASISGSPERASALLQAASDHRVCLAVDATVLPLVDPELAQFDDREVFALPSGHLDISSATHAGTVSLIDFAVARSRANGGSDLPWLAVPGTLDQALVDYAALSGAAGILAGSKLEYGRPDTDSSSASATSSSGEAVPIALANRRLSVLLATSAPTDAGAPARLVAETALLALERDPEADSLPVLIAPGESWVVDGTRASEEIAALLAAPWVASVPFGSVLEPSELATTAAAAAPKTRDVEAPTMVAAQQMVTRLADLAAATEQPALLLDGEARDVLSAVSLPARGDLEARELAIEEALEEARRALASVRVTSSSELTLVSSSGKVPITVRNDLESGVTVVVVMTSRSPRLLIDEQPVASVPPGTEQTVFVPITAVSSGDVLVTVALRSEAGATLAVAQTLKVRVRAEWGNVATGVATAALVLLLIAGVWRTAKRGRRDTRTGPSSEDAELDADPTSGP